MTLKLKKMKRQARDLDPEVKLTADDAISVVGIAELTKRISAEPHNAFLFIERAGLRLDMGNFADSLEDANMALTLEPQNPRGFAFRGLLLRALPDPDFEKAHADFTSAMLLLSAHYPVRLSVRETDELPPSELKRIVDAATREMNNPATIFRALIRRARAFHELGEYAKADKDLSMARKLEPSNPEPLLVRAELSWTESQDTGIRADVEVAFKLDSTRPEGYTALAKHYVLVEPHRPHLAVKAAEKAIKIRPDHAPAYHYLAEALAVMGETAEAQESYERATTLDPSFFLAFLGMADCAEKAGDNMVAIAALERFVQEADRVWVNGIIEAIDRIAALKSGVK